MLLQLLLNGLFAGASYALVGISFSLIFQTARFFHFAHGAVFTAAAYGAYVSLTTLTPSVPLAFVVALLTAIALGLLMEYLVYSPLRRRRATPLALLITSLGLLVVIQNGISLIFGDETRALRSWGASEGYLVAGARATGVQLVTLGTALASLVLMCWLLYRSRAGVAIRAVASNPELAELSGIRSGRVRLAVFGLSSALAAITALLVGFDVDIRPGMGVNALLMGVVSSVVGGTANVLGVLLGAFVLGVLQNISTIYVTAEWQDSITFGLFLVVLLLRPSGLLGRAAITTRG
jgi:branched-chain amino acid transport system permease protein